MRSLLHLLLLLTTLCCGFSACNSVVQLSAQSPKNAPTVPTYQRVGVYFPPASIPTSLLTAVDGDLFRLGELQVVIDDAARGTIISALEAVSVKVIVYDTMLTFKMMKARDLDAFFWPAHFGARSMLEREGSLIPSYTSYSSVSMKLMRRSGFQGTLDSMTFAGSGNFHQYRTSMSKSGIAKVGAEIALRDLATRIVTALGAQF